jgi:hypothetical protein
MQHRSCAMKYTVRSTGEMLRRGIPALLVLIWVMNSPLILAARDLAIPKPTDVLMPPPPPPTLEPSVVNLAIGSTLWEMRTAVESSIPVHHRHEEEWIPGRRQLNGMPFEYQYYLWRGPVQFRIENDRLVTEFPDVRYRVRVRLKESNGVTQIAECGYGPDAHMRLRLEASSEVRWSEDWVIRTETRFGRPQFGEPCRLRPIDLDVTELLNDWLNERLPSLATAIDRTFYQQVDAKKRAQMIWESLQEPMELNAGTWLLFRPQDPQAGVLNFDRNESVRTVVSMMFEPMIVVGARPHIDPRPLPPLQTGPNAQEGFHLAVPLLVPYEALNHRLATEVVGEEIVPPVGSPIQITGIRTYGSGDALICEVTVKGGVNGKLYLQGKPALAPDGRTLALRHFMFTMETSNLLVRLANRTMYDTIRDTILPYTKIDVSDRIEVLRRRIERHMNHDVAEGVWMESTVTKLVPHRIYPVKGGIEMQLLIDGTLGISLD